MRLTTSIICYGYVNWVEPAFITRGERFYMLGDHGPYCPVEFR